MGVKGWFKLPGAPGKCTLEQQLTGLGELWNVVRGHTVLDVGCAEGLIGKRCLEAGAAAVHGVENRLDAVKMTRALGIPCDHADVSRYVPSDEFDVVLLLGILHKLGTPSHVLARMLEACRVCCVIRLPHDDWPVLRDSRSGNRPFDLASVAKRSGFELMLQADGPACEGNPPQWVGYFLRSYATLSGAAV